MTIKNYIVRTAAMLLFLGSTQSTRGQASAPSQLGTRGSRDQLINRIRNEDAKVDSVLSNFKPRPLPQPEYVQQHVPRREGTPVLAAPQPGLSPTPVEPSPAIHSQKLEERLSEDDDLLDAYKQWRLAELQTATNSLSSLGRGGEELIELETEQRLQQARLTIEQTKHSIDRLASDSNADKAALALQTAAFAHNAWATRVIFWIVQFMVVAAVLASLWEFVEARRVRRAARQLPQQELALSLEGIALKTTLHGVLLLVLAMGFYFLYLKFVYPVEIVTG